MVYCLSFSKYVDDPECDQCDTRTGYVKDTWKFTCGHLRVKHHPILRQMSFWIGSSPLYYKFIHVVKIIANCFNPKKKFYIYSRGQGWKVGYMDWSGMEDK